MDAGDMLGIASRALRRLYCLLRCHCSPDGTGDGGSFLFQDIAGVDLDSWNAVAQGNPRIFSFSELYIGTSGFGEKEVLGRGGFGRVYRAVLPSDGTAVAVKCVAGVGERFEKSFAAELLAVARLRHKNLVRLRGWCVHDEKLLLVYDYMKNRSLDKHLFVSPSTPKKAAPVLEWDRRRRIVAGLAAALCYLHEQLEAQIIHRDVKASNVMLDDDFNARLGDFGLARWLEHGGGGGATPTPVRAASGKSYHFRLSETSHVGGTIGYVPPESFDRRRRGGTAKSDVFSFGIVVLEVATGRRAVDLAYPEDRIFMLDWVRRLSDEARLADAVDGKLAGSCDSSDVTRIIHIGLLCSLNNPRLRPTMKWAVENLTPGYSGKLPALPLFRGLPNYITLSDSSTSSSSASVTSKSSLAAAKGSLRDLFLAADGATMPSPTAKEMIASVDTPREIPYADIVSITGDFADAQMVAELDFGTGYAGVLGDGGVLVKRLGMKTCPALRLRYANELQNLARLRHRNLMLLRGWCTDRGEMLVVYDFSPASSLLSSHLRGGAVLQWCRRYSIARALASAVLYLHEEWEQQVVHRNITSSAVFLDADFSPRLGCFALAEFLMKRAPAGGGHRVVVAAAVRGIFGYMAPECTDNAAAATAADVYSFGVVLLELVTGEMAVDMRLPDVLLVRRVHRRISESPVSALVDRKLDGEFDAREMERLARVGIACTRSSPAARPTMREVVSILDGNEEAMEKKRCYGAGCGLEEWDAKNASALSMAKRIQALGLH